MSQTLYDQDVEEFFTGEHMICDAVLVAQNKKIARLKNRVEELEEDFDQDRAIFFVLGLLAGCTLMMLLVLVVGS